MESSNGGYNSKLMLMPLYSMTQISLALVWSPETRKVLFLQAPPIRIYDKVHISYRIMLGCEGGVLVWQSSVVFRSGPSSRTRSINVVRSIKQHAERALKSSVVEDIREAISLRHSGSVCYGSRQGNFRNPAFNKLCFYNLL